MIEYVPIQAVLDPAYFPRTLRQESDDNSILTNILDGYRLLNVTQKLVEKEAIIKLENHSATLPSDVHTINLVSYGTLKTGTYNTSTYTLNDIDLITPLRYVGNKKISMSLTDYNNSTCKVCTHGELSGCSETFSLSVFKELTASIKEGCLCIDYLAEAVNESGEYLIIKLPSVLRYLGLYAASIIFRDRAMSMEANTNQMYLQLLQQTEQAYKRAKGELHMRQIDLSLIDSLSTNSINQKLMRIPSFMTSKIDS
jgi:hypothetical protein